MNIGYLYGFEAYPPQGGNGTHVYQLVQWFQQRGHTVHTIGDRTMPGVEAYATTDRGVEDFLARIDLLYVRVDGWYLTRSPFKKACMDRAQVPIVWEINAPSNEMLAFLYLNSDEMRPRWARRAHALKRRLRAWSQLPAIWREEVVRRTFARKVSAAICISDAIERYARDSLGIERTYLVPNGSDPELNSPAQSPMALDSDYEGHFKVVYAGSPLYPWQGMDILRQVAASLRETEFKILFILLVNQLNSQVPRGRNVLVFERVNYADVPRYIRLADVCLCLCRDFPWSRWGFHLSPTKLFDYMACAKPVVASNVGQIQTVIQDGLNGFLVANNPEDVAQAILHAYRSRGQLKAMGDLARQKVLEQYNWERVADVTLEVFRSLLPNRG